MLSVEEGGGGLNITTKGENFSNINRNDDSWNFINQFLISAIHIFPGVQKMLSTSSLIWLSYHTRATIY